MDDAQLRAYFNSAPDATLLVDSDGTVREANPSVEEVFGHRVADLIGRPVDILVAPRLHDRLAALLQADRSSSLRLDARDLAAVHAEGHEFPVDVSVTPVPTGTGKRWLMAAVRDVSERQRLRHEVEIAGAQLQAFFQSAPDAMVAVDPKGVVRFANPQVTAMLGYGIEEVVGQRIEVLLARGLVGEDPEGGGFSALLDREARTRDRTARRKDGTQMYIDINLADVPMPDGSTWRLASVRDVTERHAVARQLERAQAQYRFLAEHDALTGLPNRRQLEREVRAHVDLCLADGPRGALLSLDLDHFKTVNDVLGHPTGDRLIVEVGQHLRAAVRPLDLVARQGGDEFLVLLRTGGLADARAVAERLVAAVQDAGGFLREHGLKVSGSVGVVAFEQFSTDGLSLDLAMIRADVALYAAKGAGRNRTAVFNR